MNDSEYIGQPSPSNSRSVPPSRAPAKTLMALIGPLVALALAWLAMSILTAIYISWLDEHYQGILRENVSTIRSTAVMQRSLLELQRDTNPNAKNVRARSAVIADFIAALQQAKAAAISKEEADKVDVIARTFDEYSNSTSSTKSSELAIEISGYCDELQRMNQSQIDERTRQHEAWSGMLGSVRLLLVMAGPFVGVWLGYRVALQVSKRLAAIHFRLEGATMELGKVDVSPSPNGDIEAIDLQVRKIVDRFEQMIKSLEGTRREAIRNERLAAVGTLAAGVAHEIRNPLTAVKLLVQSMRIKGTGAGSAENLRVVEEEVVRMEDTIQQLLDFARPPKPRRLRANLTQLVERAVNLVRGRGQEASISFALDLPTTCEMTCDPEQLHQVFVNLLLNAIDAMPNGGTLGVRVCMPSGKGHEVSVVVEDDGSGISPQVMEHVFEPFVTTKSRGTGLGLAITRRMVEEHKGTIVAENRLPHGARFTVLLPASSLPSDSFSEATSNDAFSTAISN